MAEGSHHREPAREPTDRRAEPQADGLPDIRSPMTPTDADGAPGRDWARWLGPGGCAAGVLGLCAVLGVPHLLQRDLRTHRYMSDTPGNVDAIGTAQLAYQAAFGHFIAVPDWTPRPVAALDADPAGWPAASGFDTLGWRPDGDRCRGTFRVTLTPDGEDFLVEGYVDRDGDGVPAYYTRTRSELTRQQTARGVE